jgi:hypothetical protein
MEGVKENNMTLKKKNLTNIHFKIKIESDIIRGSNKHEFAV